MTNEEEKKLLDALRGVALFLSDYVHSSNTITRDYLIAASDKLFDVTQKLLEKDEDNNELSSQDN